MPQAEILENLGDSQYRVRLIYDDVLYQSLINDQQLLLAGIAEKIAAAQAAVSEAETALQKGDKDHADASDMVTAAIRLNTAYQEVQRTSERVVGANSLVDSLSGQAASVQDDLDAAELSEASAQDSVNTLTDERDVLQNEHDNLVYLQQLNEQACRESGYQGESCVLAAEYEEKAVEKLDKLESKAQELGEAEDELNAAGERVMLAVSKLNELEGRLRDAESELRQHELALSSAEFELVSRFGEYNSLLMEVRGETIEASPDGYDKRVELHQGELAAAVFELNRLNADLQQARRLVQMLTAEKTSEEARLDQLKESSDPPELTCWASTWKPDFDVGTEVDVLLMPGEPAECVIHASGLPTHRLIPRAWQQPDQVLLNAMLLPGWQRHMYPFGTGVVTTGAGGKPAVLLADGATLAKFDTWQLSAGGVVDVIVDDNPSTAQALTTARESVLNGISAGLLFADGDRVLIDYSGDEPTAPAFFEQPREAGLLAGYHNWFSADESLSLSWAPGATGSRYHGSQTYSPDVYSNGAVVAQLPAGYVIGAGVVEHETGRKLVIAGTDSDAGKYAAIHLYVLDEAFWWSADAAPGLIKTIATPVEVNPFWHNHQVCFSPDGRRFGQIHWGFDGEYLLRGTLSIADTGSVSCSHSFGSAVRYATGSRSATKNESDKTGYWSDATGSMSGSAAGYIAIDYRYPAGAERLLETEVSVSETSQTNYSYTEEIIDISGTDRHKTTLTQYSETESRSIDRVFRVDGEIILSYREHDYSYSITVNPGSTNHSETLTDDYIERYPTAVDMRTDFVEIDEYRVINSRSLSELKWYLESFDDEAATFAMRTISVDETWKSGIEAAGISSYVFNNGGRLFSYNRDAGLKFINITTDDQTTPSSDSTTDESQAMVELVSYPAGYSPSISRVQTRPYGFFFRGQNDDDQAIGYSEIGTVEGVSVDPVGYIR